MEPSGIELDKHETVTQLVREAGMGDKKSMEKLLAVTRPRLFAYLLRLTVDYHLAEDLLQEVQTEIVMSLWRLNKPDRFWPWIYKHAWGKVRHHYRDSRKHKAIFMSEMEKDFFDEQVSKIQLQRDGGWRDANTEKLFETIYAAMKKLGLKQRNVLTMRCFEEMSFFEIGQFLECSETSARVLFFRAKHKLKNQLRRDGYRANRMILPALGLFGAITAKTPVASTPAMVTSVSGAALEVGFGASFIGFLTTKSGFLMTSLCSGFLAWFTFTHLLFIFVITILLFPLILLLLFSVVYDR